MFGPQVGPVRPHISPSSVLNSIPALVPGTAQTVTLLGSDFDLVTDVLLNCMPIELERYTIVSPTEITIDMPQAPVSENWPGTHTNLLAVTDGIYTAGRSCWIYAPAGPVYQLGKGEPLNVVDRDDGLSFVLSGPIGSVQYL